ncbi:MAG: LacI family transcriptional regulator [Ruminococcaceae bacterium]|nr:LacI family transcriptional regulator [Oscillospiraceae bacterium]
MNLKMIAELADVSVSTVSKAFSGSDEISEKTRQRIFDIARSEGCFEHYNKNKFQKKVIAVVCPEIHSEYYSSFMTILNDEISSKGCIMISAESNFNTDRELEYFDYFTEYAKVDGVILVQAQSDIQNTMNIPTVVMSGAPKGKNVDNIIVSRKDAVAAAVHHLKENGHTKIGYAGERLTEGTLRSICSAMRHEGLTVDPKLHKKSDMRFEAAGKDIALQFLKEKELPTAIFAAYDKIAIGIIKVFKKNGIRIPEDVSVIGMDNISATEHIDPALSTIHTHMDDACRKAVEIVMKKLENRYYREREKIFIESDFIPRESSGKAPLR